MTRSTLVMAVVIGVAVVVILLQEADILSFRALIDAGRPQTAESTRDGEDGPPGLGAAAPRAAGEGDQGDSWAGQGAEVSFEAIRRLIAGANAEQRRALLANEEKFRELVRQEARNQSLLAAARANNLHQDANVRFLMERAADNVLREVYLKRLFEKNLPDDFPSDDQVREYYEKNRDRFHLDDRLHVWQVFLPVTGDMDEKRVQSIREKAEAIAADIRSGKVGFSRAALEFSSHQPSRNNGGYMGLVKVNELRPELAEPILDLKAGEISEPVRTEEGIHIIKKGESVSGREVALDEVRGQIRNLLRNQAAGRIGEAIRTKAEETYPVEVEETRVEEWRLRLRTDTPAAEGSSQSLQGGPVPD